MAACSWPTIEPAAMGFLTTKRDLSIPMLLSGDQALAAARTAVAELDWPLEETEPGTLVATEDFARLHCHCQPMSVKIGLSASDEGRSTLLLRASVPGRGPIASQHLRTQSDVLARRIRSLEPRAPTEPR